MLKIAVCDDDPVHLERAVSLVNGSLEQENIKYSVQPFPSASVLLSEVEKNGYSPDIAVLDIEMEGEDGITLAKKLNQILPLCRIIFLTGYLDYAMDVYSAEHIWFVVKSTADRYFKEAMNKALQTLNSQNSVQSVIVVRQKGSSIAVPLERIRYISKVGRKSCVFTADGEYSDTRRPAFLIPEHLQSHFIRCHQGYWVNIRMIRELDHDEFVLTDGSRIPLSRGFREEARKRFFESLHI